MHIIHLHTYIHTYIHIYTYIYTRDGNPRQPQHKHTKAEPRRTRYDWLASEYWERARQSERAPQNPTTVFHASLLRPPKIPDSGIVSMVNYMQVLRS